MSRTECIQVLSLPLRVEIISQNSLFHMCCSNIFTNLLDLFIVTSISNRLYPTISPTRMFWDEFQNFNVVGNYNKSTKSKNPHFKQGNSI